MNFGSIYIDFAEPINCSEKMSEMKLKNPEFDPLNRREDKLKFNNEVGHQLIFAMQKAIRIMPCTLVSAILLLYRKGISETELQQKVKWLGMALLQRGITVGDDAGIPTQTTVNIGLKQLDEFVVRKRDVVMPKVAIGENQNYDYSSIIILAYYRNALNYAFFNESIIVCSLYSFGVEEVWEKGTSLDALFERACYLSELIKKEEVLEERITSDNRAYFNKLIQFMIEQRLLVIKPGQHGEIYDLSPGLQGEEKYHGQERVFPKSDGEASMLMLGSICWPMIDTYYIAVISALSMVKNRDIEETKCVKDCQLIAETLHSDGKIAHFESCNQPSINNAKAKLIEMKVLSKRSNFINLSDEYKQLDGEKRLLKLIQHIGQYRMKPISQGVFDEIDPEVRNLRRTVLHDFPIMAKL